MNNNNTQLFSLVDQENNSYSLISSSFEEFEPTFSECGYEGGGYDFEAVARQTKKLEIKRITRQTFSWKRQ